MCDDLTRDDENAALAARGLSRREFAALGAAAAAVTIGGCAVAASGDGAHGVVERPIIERTVRIATPAGTADAVFVHPTSGAHPGIVMWPDIAGLRDVFKAMARRLARQGYAVLVVNQYYRNAPAPVLESFAQWRTPEGQARLKPMIAAITPAATVEDARAFVAFLDGEPAVDRARRIGTCGYCMGGPFAVRTAAAVPGRVCAVASLHGANLASDDPDSPVKLIAATQASYLFAIARGDDARMPEVKDKLKQACAAAHRPAEIEVYPAEHGWCVADTPAYDAAAAEKACARMEALFAGL